MRLPAILAVLAFTHLSAPLPAASDTAPALATRAQEALRADRPAEALADFRALEKLADTPAAASAARQGAHAALSALYREEQQRAILLPAHRALLAAPDSALAWWAWAQACLRAGDVDSVGAARRALDRLHTLPDATAELRIELARAASSPDVIDRLLRETIALLEPALPSADLADSVLTDDQRFARDLNYRLNDLWSRQTHPPTSHYGEEESPEIVPPSPGERPRLYATVRQARALVDRTRDRASQTADAAGEARDRLHAALASGDPHAATLAPAFDTAVAAYDPALQTRQLAQARQRLDKLHALDAADRPSDYDELLQAAHDTAEEYDFRALVGNGFLSAQKDAARLLALLATRAAFVPPAADAPPAAHIACLAQLAAFTDEGWTLTRPEQRAQARALLALDEPLPAAAVLHGSLALASDGPQPDDTALLRALADRSAALAREAEKSWLADDRVSALSDWHDAARLAPGDPAAWRALFLHARLADGADELALEAAGRLWQLDALSRDEIFQAGSIALSLGRPDWTHVLLSRLPDGGISNVDTQMLRTLHALRYSQNPEHTREPAQLSRLHPDIGCLAALNLVYNHPVPPEWQALETLRKKISSSAPPVASTNTLPARPVLGDPVLSRFDARRRPGTLPPDTRPAPVLAAALAADQSAALALAPADLPAAVRAWARAAGAVGQPADFAPLAPVVATTGASRPEKIAALLDLEPSLLKSLSKPLLHPLPTAVRDEALRQRQTAALERLRATYANAPSAQRRSATKAYFAAMNADMDALNTLAEFNPRRHAEIVFTALGTDTDRRFDILMSLPDSGEAKALLATLTQSERAVIRERATKIVSDYNQQVARQITNVLGLESRFSTETINAALDQIARLPADHPDRATLYNISSSTELRREIVIRHAQPIADRAKARREAATLAGIALAAAQNRTGTWEEARSTAYAAGGEHLARYLASAPNIQPREVQSALASGTMPASWISRLQSAGVTAALRIERETRARTAEYEARTGGGRYNINQGVYNSRYNASGSGYQSYEKAMRRELDRLYPTGK